MPSIKKTVRQNYEMASCIRAISHELPAIKESEVVGFCFSLMAQDFLKKSIDGSIWRKMLKENFEDKEVSDYAETRGITIGENDFNIVVTGKDDPNNTWAYLKQEGVSRAPLALVTRLVLYYCRRKLITEAKETEAKEVKAPLNMDDYLDLIEKAISKTIHLLRDNNYNKIINYLEER